MRVRVQRKVMADYYQEHREYADPHFPLDRWAQAPYARDVNEVVAQIRSVGEASTLDVIIDPFCGLGSSALACRLLEHPFVGIEVRPSSYLASLAKHSATEDVCRRALGLLRTWPLGGSVKDLISGLHHCDLAMMAVVCLAIRVLHRSSTVPDRARVASLVPIVEQIGNDCRSLGVPSGVGEVFWGKSADVLRSISERLRGQRALALLCPPNVASSVGQCNEDTLDALLGPLLSGRPESLDLRHDSVEGFLGSSSGTSAVEIAAYVVRLEGVLEALRCLAKGSRLVLEYRNPPGFDVVRPVMEAAERQEMDARELWVLSDAQNRFGGDVGFVWFQVR